ncbi:MAG: 16S rRNA (guanine(966)-N(2))-methyltransferase RsmD [Solirubrobacterales bacterium]
MRVVAGAYSGRRLTAPRGGRIRPTADRVREALFSILGPMEALRVLDLFAGSGALGIEALSRGAQEATFVDSNQAAVRAVRENLERVGSEHGRVFRADVTSFLRGAARHGDLWDLVLCDPPYRLAHRLGPALGPLLTPVLDTDARIVCESSSKHPLRLDLPVIGERRYGDTSLVIHADRP